MEYELVKVDSQGRINIPKEYMSRLGIKAGDLLAISIKGNLLIIGKVKIELPPGLKPFKPITEEQIHTILDLCRELDVEPPHDLESLSYETAEALIREYRSRLEKSGVSEAKEYLGMEKGEKPASMDQKRYVKYLSKKAGIPISDEELEKMTSKEASRRIKELKEKLGMK